MEFTKICGIVMLIGLLAGYKANTAAGKFTGYSILLLGVGGMIYLKLT